MTSDSAVVEAVLAIAQTNLKMLGVLQHLRATLAADDQALSEQLKEVTAAVEAQVNTLGKLING